MLSKNTILKARRAIESSYNAKADVFEEKKVKEGVTTKFRQVKVHSCIPCRISYSDIDSTSPSDTTAGLVQVIKLFTSPKHKILPGSKIVAKGVAYKSSGQPAVYPTHQEIILELWKENA